ncbi:p-toluenesulfonate methyl-monooxygenase reductase component TsaB [Pseudacidovorax intermedius]|uniref:p-toluenesulfonate methyl-monooxygenase reductase component TsaB n=1 Tax=Pseudacidovorax intermedius TaxID=433924 RepID=A0A370FCY7_9BURK|nr:PDR/VanB family oxidoreductase [Pseudacidovorax intermedius]RDI23370.1 p-toluenesulfonate methyl-monooxygenase reductase component TsaB [Pseudacidovorax intermedius]
MSSALPLVVESVRAVARDVLQLVLRHAEHRPLPGAAPGAHIDLLLPAGPTRQYSLVNAAGAANQDRYEIAVGWDMRSRGGSRWIHEQLKVGQAVDASAPRNLFAMRPQDRRVLLVAGGIGITPIVAMARHCARQGLDWELLACARSAARLAYLEELRELAGARLRLHLDDEQDGPPRLDALLREPRWDGVYACGPAPMLDALQAATRHWPAGRLHMERFAATATPAGDGTRRDFELVLARSGCSTRVGADESVLAALGRLGIEHPSACREGLCGTCEVAVLDGEVRHLDAVLDAADPASRQRMMACVSRCAGERLVLDL